MTRNWTGAVVLLTYLGTTFLVGGCKEAGFSGSTKSHRDGDKVSSELPRGQTTYDAEGVTPADRYTGKELPVETGIEADITSNLPTGTLAGGGGQQRDLPSGFQEGLGRLFGNVISSFKDIKFDRRAQTTDEEIEFGKAATFHIGDGNFASSSECYEMVQLTELKGTSYFFEFTVGRDDTKVEITVGQLCGVDYSKSNVMTLADEAGQELLRKMVQRGDKRFKLGSRRLNAGKYVLFTESQPATADEPHLRTGRGQVGDRDDYIIGRIRVRADGPVTAGQYGAK